jgi:uncharacterized protein YqfA (UPF0365 family)
MFELLVPLIPIIVVIFIIYIFFQFIPVGLWISAIAAGVKVGIFTLIYTGRIMDFSYSCRSKGGNFYFSRYEA